MRICLFLLEPPFALPATCSASWLAAFEVANVKFFEPMPCILLFVVLWSICYLLKMAVLFLFKICLIPTSFEVFCMSNLVIACSKMGYLMVWLVRLPPFSCLF